MFNGVQVFSATMVADRERLGEKVTDWLARKRKDSPTFELREIKMMQSSDNQFHCVSCIVFYNERLVARARR